MSITAPGKVVACATEDEFAKCTSDHPGGLTIAHFWASWAPACAHMNEVMVELAKQYPYVTFLTVCLAFALLRGVFVFLHEQIAGNTGGGREPAGPFGRARNQRCTDFCLLEGMTVGYCVDIS